jgi:NAD(P)-dependent dehydrogenase (short-subunit alcohol dehydrogenase family)
VQRAVQQLVDRWGCIDIVFSYTGATVYSVTKAGLVGMIKMLAVELGPRNIRVNVICPGRTETEVRDYIQQKDVERITFPVQYPKGQIPLGEGKPATSMQVAQLILFLASDATSHITGTGGWIDGGFFLI